MYFEHRLYFSKKEGVSTIEFGSDYSNAFSCSTLDRLEENIRTCSEDRDTKIILLKTEGTKVFSGGTYLKELHSITNKREGEFFFNHLGNVLIAMIQCKKPIIGRVQGKCVGGALGLVSACDYVYSNEKASIKLSNLASGIGPFLILPSLISKTNKSAFSELFFQPNDWKSAYWAKENKLYTKVFENPKEMDKELEFFIEKISKYPMDTLLMFKECMKTDTETLVHQIRGYAKICGELILSDYCQNILKK